MNTYPPIEIAKPGRAVPVKGAAFDFTPAILADLAESYDPTLFEAPLVAGHPELNSPAYGSVGTVRYDAAAQRLEAVPSDVHPSFAQAVNDRLYRAVSLSMYLPDSPANPKPGHHYLRHVGFLGAHPPAIKGLREPAFAADEPGVVSFGEWDDQINAGLWRKLKNFFIAQFGQDSADQALPEDDLNYLQLAAAEEAARENAPETGDGGPMPAFAQTPAEAEMTTQTIDLAEREAQLAERETALNARATALAEQERQADQARCLDFAEQLVKDGKLLPRERDGFAAFLASVPAETALSFGEGESATETTGRAWLEDFARGLPQRVDFGEFDLGEGEGTGASTDAAIARRAREYHAQETAAGRPLSFAEAVDAVHANADRPA